MQISKYLLAALLSGAYLGIHAENPYAGGMFIMNEEQSGNPGNGSINFFKPEGDGQWDYRVFRQANPGKEIPGAICHARFYGDKLYVVSNHPKMAGSYDMAGTLTILDAETLVWLDAIEIYDGDLKTLQGRAVLPVSDSEVYLSTTEGILRYNVADGKLLVAEPVLATLPPADAGEPIPYQYPYQYGAMVRIGDKVYAVGQKNLLTIIPVADPQDVEVVTAEKINRWHGTSAEMQNGWGAGSIVVANDGTLWVSLSADMDASGTPAKALLRCDFTEDDPYKRYMVVAVPEDVYPPANSWYAWTPDGFHSSATGNLLYWNGGESSWFSNSQVFRYDIDKNEFSKVMDLTSEELPAGETPWMIYGCSMRTSPVSGDMFLSLFKDYAGTEYVVRRLDAEGNKVADYNMDAAIWFPALPVFVDVEGPAFKQVEDLVLSAADETRVDLLGYATDPDSPDAEINYAVNGVSDGSKFTAKVDGRQLVVTPAEADTEGDYWVDLTAESQGKTAVGRVNLRFSKASVEGVSGAVASPAIYVSGAQLMLRNDTCASMAATIYNPEGRAMKQVEAPAGESVHSLSDLPAGVYVVRLGASTLKFRL